MKNLRVMVKWSHDETIQKYTRINCITDYSIGPVMAGLHMEVLSMNISRVRIAVDKPFPSNEIELRLYQSVFNETQKELNSKFSKLFIDNGWSVPWVNGVYAFHHFHAEAHEVLGCAAGWVIVQMGGPNGPEIRLEAGDA